MVQQIDFFQSVLVKGLYVLIGFSVFFLYSVYFIQTIFDFIDTCLRGVGVLKSVGYAFSNIVQFDPDRITLTLPFAQPV